jgi:CHAT domain-containing protein
MFSLRRYRQAVAGLALSLGASAGTLEEGLKALRSGDPFTAWAIVEKLQASYQPGTQPPEFFWLRGRLLEQEHWELASKNFEPLLQSPLRSQALASLIRGWQSTNPQRSQNYFQDLVSQSDFSALDLILVQAQVQRNQGRAWEAKVCLRAAESLLQLEPTKRSSWAKEQAALAAQLGDWPRFAQTCQMALQSATCGEELQSAAALWVDQLLPRRTQESELQACGKALQACESRWSGWPRQLLRIQRARLVHLGLQQSPAKIFVAALAEPMSSRQRVAVKAYRSYYTRERAARREALDDLQRELQRLGPLSDGDPLRKPLPSLGIGAALGDTYLPEQPEQAWNCYFQTAAGGNRLRLLNHALIRFSQAGALNYARRTLGELLQALRQGGVEATPILRSQMFALRAETGLLTRLFMTDEAAPAPESPSALVLQELLQATDLHRQIELDVQNRLRLANTDREVAEAYLSRSELLLAQGRWGEAQLALERSLEAAQRGGWSLYQAMASRMLAYVFWTTGQADPAIEAIAEAERLFGNSPRSQECHLIGAYYLLRSGRPQQALPLLEGSDTWSVFLRGRAYLAQNQRAQAERCFRLCRFEEPLSEVGRLVFLGRSCEPKAADQVFAQAFQMAEGLGSLRLREVALEWMPLLGDQAREALRQRASQKLLALLEEYPAEVRQRLLDSPPTARLLGLSQPSKTDLPVPQKQEFLAQINQLGQRYPELDTQLAVSPGEFAALQQRLEKGQALLQYFLADTELYAMVAESEGCRLVQVAVEKGRLQQWLQQAGQLEVASPATGQLYAALIEPLQLKAAKVQLIPHSFLWYVPWDALQNREGRFLVEEYDLTCVSPAELLRPPAPDIEERRVVAIGGTRDDLPATRQEALMVASLFADGKALVGAEASRAQLKKWAPSAQVLHLATHSALASDLNATYIELSDGRLRLEEIYSLQMPPGSTVVLSSCDSARGQAQPGREVASLASAFLNAGAARVVATRWPVEDSASAQFCSTLYGHWKAGLGLSAALRQARMDHLHESPSHWGAYQLIGDPDW